MNKILHLSFIQKCFLGVLMLLCVAGCNKDEGFTDPKLFIETESISASNASSEHVIDFVTNNPWTVEADVDWITFSEQSGDKGKKTLVFTVLKNEDDARTGVITISSAEGFKKEIQVIQEAGNRDDIYVKVNGTGEGFSWEDATSLETALGMAVSGNTIHIAEGVYVPTLTITGGDASDNRDKTFEISKYLKLKGGYPANATKGTAADHTRYATVLSGELDGGGAAYHVVTVSAPKTEGQKVVLEGLKISHGNAGTAVSSATISGLNFRRDYGGGITIGNAVVDITDTEIVDNKSEKNVAGLYAFEGAVVTLTRCKVNNNLSSGNAGGVWISESSAYISDSEFIANRGGTAAGVHGYPDATIHMYNSVIADNRGSSYGAAFYIRQNSKGVLVNCLITGNTSSSTNGGGGVMMYNNTEVSLISSTITKNTISGPGGGVYRRLGVNKLHIYNSIISGNKQKNNGPDVDVYEAGALAPVIKSSVIGSAAYGLTGEEIAGASFNAGSMLDADYVPVGPDNPALVEGMPVAELMKVGNSMSPAVEQSIISADLFNNSRTGLQIMGALVDGE
ncbi:MAG: right-handed parallel beta-helix repeat-containing protein [Adhaeribacter sp.]